jgi:hypothetical protein
MSFDFVKVVTVKVTYIWYVRPCSLLDKSAVSNVVSEEPASLIISTNK